MTRASEQSERDEESERYTRLVASHARVAEAARLRVLRAQIELERALGSLRGCIDVECELAGAAGDASGEKEPGR